MFLPELERMLAGAPAALRPTFAVVDREVRAWDAAHGTTVCGDLVDDWADELRILRSSDSGEGVSARRRRGGTAAASGDASSLASH
jgi:hypothetical protein